MTYKIEFSRAAAKQLADIPHIELKKLAKRIEKLADNPLPQGHQKMEGCEALYRIRQGDYRILYSIFKDKLLVLIVKIGHRRDRF